MLPIATVANRQRNEPNEKAMGRGAFVKTAVDDGACDMATNWDLRFMELAQFVGAWSKDRSTRVGCVIVGPHNEIRAVGYNGFPRGLMDDLSHRHDRPAKYQWTEHAERNAIYHAALVGVPLSGCKMYLPWFPCMDCARAIVQCGIKELYAFEPNFHDARWGHDFSASVELLKEAGVHVQFLRAPPAKEKDGSGPSGSNAAQ